MPSPEFVTLAGFPVAIRLAVQWGDQDAFGHVNNVVAFRWFESARVAYLSAAGLEHLMTNQGLGPILASVKCDYRRQIKYPDHVHLGAAIRRIGRTSLQMDHAVFSETQQAVVSEGTSVVVLFNYLTQSPTPIPPEMRAKIEALEGEPR